MTKDQIITRLMLDAQCLLDNINNGDRTKSDRSAQEFVNNLINKGYRMYPVYYKQTPKEKIEIENLLSMKP
jgi:hypothetical protein